MADQPSTARRLSTVPIRQVDYARYKDDPIGMGLAGLQNALTAGIQKANMRQAEDQEEHLKIAEDLYKAYELAGVEKQEQDVADEFFKATGKSIHAYTKSHARRVDSASGRIRARAFTEDLEDRVKSGEFNNVEELQAAWDAEQKDLEAFHPGNIHYAGGFLEQGANALFTEAVVDIETNIRLNNPTITEEEAETVLLNGLEGAMAGEHYADIEEVSHILDQLGSISRPPKVGCE
jgi:hypothetical protein